MIAPSLPLDRLKLRLSPPRAAVASVSLTWSTRTRFCCVRPRSCVHAGRMASGTETGEGDQSREKEERGEAVEFGEEEWRDFGVVSSWSTRIPDMVLESMKALKSLASEVGAPMTFGGIGGKIRGLLKAEEETKHRTMYEALVDSEKKMQFFSARQIACRLLGSRKYLCPKCWLPLHEDCMCSKLLPCSLWRGLRFWLYMHPKDYLRQNNTGKLLYQTFGVEQARLCLFGIYEHEESMWKAFQNSGRLMVWCLYPNQHSPSLSVKDMNFSSITSTVETNIQRGDGEMPVLNFILVDGTWNNSAAMVSRLKDHAMKLWGSEGLNFIALAIPGASVMHRLRAQPSRDRSCTAAAAADLLTELHQLPHLSHLKLDKSAEALNDGLESLLSALTNRRLRMGRSVTRTIPASRRAS